ncbi:hypothetical protein VDP25_17170 [Winogradskyella sp. ECml5-4]|uniref:hypothetical protein n=1 Tax=Winogradskyella sp. ECml5-4 TaxID=3110975 RepID=UPI002FF08DCC
MDKKDDKIVLFIKFGSEENIKSLYEKGLVYLNTIEYFQNLEDKGVRGDKYEATTNIKNYDKPENYKLIITDTKTGEDINIKPSKLQMRHFEVSPKGNLYSLYCLKQSDFSNTNEIVIDSRVKSFGTHAVFIRGTKKFLNKLCKEVEKLKMGYKSKPVEYYDKDKINGPINLFQKIKEYEYQSEYRFVVQNSGKKPLKINIGSLEEYSEMLNIDTMDDLKIIVK